MYRDFIYLDIDRIQSIISQLQEGLLKDALRGTTLEASGTTGQMANLVSFLLPSISGKRQSDIKETKVLHDYAFNLALQSLENESLLLDNVSSIKRELDGILPIPEVAFVLARGSAKIRDYRTLSDMGKHEPIITRLMNPQQATEDDRFVDWETLSGKQRTQLNTLEYKVPTKGRTSLRDIEPKNRIKLMAVGLLSEDEKPASNQQPFGDVSEFVDAFYKDIIDTIFALFGTSGG